MGSPGEILPLPVFAKEWKSVNSSNVGIPRVPRSTYMGLDDVFDGRSCCMLGYLSIEDNGECDQIDYVAYAAKKKAVSTEEGRICEYANKFKTVAIGTPTLLITPWMVQKNAPILSRRRIGHLATVQVPD